MPMNRPRDQLLAGAAFAGDEHGRVGGRHQRDPFENLLHGGAAAQQFIIGLGHVSGTGIQCRRGRQQLAPLCQGPAQNAGRVLQIKRFGQIVERPVAHRPHRRVEIAKGGNHDDRHRGARFGKAGHGSETVHAGQTHVEHDQIERLAAGDRQAIFGR